jgi:hypothetical protein
MSVHRINCHKINSSTNNSQSNIVIIYNLIIFSESVYSLKIPMWKQINNLIIDSTPSVACTCTRMYIIIHQAIYMYGVMFVEVGCWLWHNGRLWNSIEHPAHFGTDTTRIMHVNPYGLHSLPNKNLQLVIKPGLPFWTCGWRPGFHI